MPFAVRSTRHLCQRTCKDFSRVHGGKDSPPDIPLKGFFGSQSKITGSSADYMEQRENRKEVSFYIIIHGIAPGHYNVPITSFKPPAPQMSWTSG
jgi:hypothetical protein